MPIDRSSNPWQGEAIVDEEIQPYKSGRVKFRGTYWEARCDRKMTFVPGEVVRVLRRENLTLVVERLE
ncbi:NfeD family protein [Oscillatoria sp. FACHB-1406]|uniref:NfeD family protein n=1 Tax=Oscillatoria sp. FACHB-1406 TaxID=2692846 RepID=UPI0016823793|nr:NfeD family protein [Oscillatoria sp. FACHB-1406]MBD2577929.1 NfeD family protein [Oscillatoria sp. FACHB-1406]